MKISDEDYKRFYIPGGEEGFSEARNKHVVEESIKKHEANIQRKQKAYWEQVQERADAVASYLHSKAAGDGKPIEQYLGRQELARLRGQKRMEKIRTLMNGDQVIEFEEIN